MVHASWESSRGDGADGRMRAASSRRAGLPEVRSLSSAPSTPLAFFFGKVPAMGPKQSLRSENFPETRRRKVRGGRGKSGRRARAHRPPQGNTGAGLSAANHGLPGGA